jgi:hypothetical protein
LPGGDVALGRSIHHVSRIRFELSLCNREAFRSVLKHPPYLPPARLEDYVGSFSVSEGQAGAVFAIDGRRTGRGWPHRSFERLRRQRLSWNFQ